MFLPVTYKIKKKEILASRHGVTSACVKKRNKLPSRVKKKTSPVSPALLRLRRSPSRVQSRGAVVLLHPVVPNTTLGPCTSSVFKAELARPGQGSSAWWAVNMLTVLGWSHISADTG
uniref:Uncharacterized protein n=1 Tax=Oryza glumipatula TaxID=40148 RepID=A0A0E0A1B9_9ORYZ